MANQQKTYTEIDVQAARLEGIYSGRAEAMEFLQGRIAQVIRTNRELFTQILSLEHLEPAGGVVIPYAFAEKIVEKLRENNKEDYHAKMMKYFMHRSDRRMLERWKQYKREVESGPTA
jgi:hypothetical protein